MNTLKKEGTQWNQSDPESVSLYTSAVRMATVNLGGYNENSGEFGSQR